VVAGESKATRMACSMSSMATRLASMVVWKNLGEGDEDKKSWQGRVNMTPNNSQNQCFIGVEKTRTMTRRKETWSLHG
jgi:hypothetical protein